MDPKPTKPVSPTIIDAYQRTVPQPKDARSSGIRSVEQVGGKQKCTDTFCYDFFDFAVRRGDCFVSFGSTSRPPNPEIFDGKIEPGSSH